MPVRLTRREFRQWAEGQKQRNERIHGEPVAMSPERIEHVPGQESHMGSTGSRYPHSRLAL